jgi:hypothetical protein
MRFSHGRVDSPFDGKAWDRESATGRKLEKEKSRGAKHDSHREKRPVFIGEGI